MARFRLQVGVCYQIYAKPQLSGPTGLRTAGKARVLQFHLELDDSFFQ